MNLNKADMSGSDSDYASDHSDVKGHCRCIVKHEALHADELSLDIGGKVTKLDLGSRYILTENQ